MTDLITSTKPPRHARDVFHAWMLEGATYVCTYWLQQHLKLAIPQARCDHSNYMDVLAGHPKHSTIAIGARSMVRKRDDRAVLKESLRHIVDELQPLNILWYGSSGYGVCDYVIQKQIPITFYEAKGRGKLKSKRKGNVSDGRS